MGGKVGSVIGLAGGVLAVVGFFLPWMTLVINLEPLGALAGPLQQALFGGSAPAPVSFSGKDFLTMLTGGTQAFLAVPGAPAGAPSPDLGGAATSLTLLAAVVGLVLLLSLLTTVFSGVNLATGRLRGGLIGSGAGLLVLSVLLLVGLQMLIGIIHQGLQQAALGSAGAAAGALGDLGTLLPRVFQLSVSPGIYLGIAGGALGIAGGILGRKRVKKEPVPAEAAAAPAPAAEEAK